ncbi:MAG: TIGR00266 family protein [Bdellovibrionota bacterium]|nr:TIGR00266 family protein [Bdellovibrionota bacterium]
MKVEKLGGKAFSYIEFTLDPGQGVRTEPGAMASMDAGIDVMANMNGGFFTAILMFFFGKESFFINTFKNLSQNPQKLVVSKCSPGEIVEHKLEGETLFLQPGAFVAGSAGVKYKLSWAGISSWLAREGLFRIRCYGTGTVWYGAYGAVVEREIDGEYIVDSGHLLSYGEEMSYTIKMSGGIFSSIFGGEGLVLKMQGKGTIRLQTRSVGGLAGWLNPRFTRSGGGKLSNLLDLFGSR